MDAESSGESPPFATASAADQQRQHVNMTSFVSDDTCILGGCADHADDIDLHVNSDDEDDDNDDGALPFALSHGSRDQLLSESFLKANDALGLSLAATTISTRSAASDDMSVHDHHQHQYSRHRQQTWASSPRTSDQQNESSEGFYTPRSDARFEHQSQPSAVRDPELSSGSERVANVNLISVEQTTPNGKMKPSPNCISQPVLGSTRKHSGISQSPRRRYSDDNDWDDRPSPAAAAAAEAAAALYLASPSQPAAPAASASSSASISSSFILQSPPVEQSGSYDNEHEARYPILQRRDSPRGEESSATGSSTGNMEIMSGLMEAPLFPTQSLLTGDDQSEGSATCTQLYQSTTSLGFSELMHKAENGGGTGGGDSFALISSPLRPVAEETPSKEESNDCDEACHEDDRISHTSTPPMSNVGVGGATIVPPAPSPVNLPSSSATTIVQHGMPTSQALQRRRRRSLYRTMGPSVHTTQLSGDSFSVSTHLPSPCSVREVVDVLANPDLLRLWCVPVKNAIITSEGVGADGGISGTGSSSGGGRQYDGEWVEITTPQLVSPSSSCTSCLYRGITATKAVLGFETEGYVKMFVERNRGQVGLSVGPFMGGMVADHTITVGDNCALVESPEQSSNESASLSVTQSNNNGVVITDTVRVRKDVDLVATDGGYSCGLFGLLERYALPSISGYMTQAALSLENLCDIVCDGEACALAGTCSVDFSEDRGLGDDGCDGRTPLLAQG